MSHSILTQYSLQTTSFKIMERIIEDDRLTIRVEPRTRSAACPLCGETTQQGYDHRQKESRIRYETWHGCSIDLLIRKRRFRCTNTNCSVKIFTERIKDIAQPFVRYTKTFSTQCLQTLAVQNFEQTERTHHVSFGTVVAMLDRAVPLTLAAEDWRRLFPDGMTLVLGIDEHSFRKRRFVLTITNVMTGELIAVLPDATQSRLEGFLGSIPSDVRARISCVAMDLTNRYASAVKQWCKGSRISVDHFHLVQLANRLLWHERSVIEGGICGTGHPVKHFMLLLKGQERFTKDERELVANIFEDPACAKLKLAYETKEELRTVLHMKNRKEAVARFMALTRRDAWNRERTTRQELLKYSKAYRTFIGTLQRYKTEIITFIETRVTNAVTEGINTKIKLLKRLSYGIPNLIHYMKRLILAFRPELSTHHV